MGETFDEAFGDAYQTFTVKARDGRDVELAVMEEFEFDGRLYVAAARVEDDTIRADGVYLYRCLLREDDFDAVEITSAVEYRRVSEAYLALDEAQRS